MKMTTFIHNVIEFEVECQVEERNSSGNKYLTRNIFIRTKEGSKIVIHLFSPFVGPEEEAGLKVKVGEGATIGDEPTVVKLK